MRCFLAALTLLAGGLCTAMIQATAPAAMPVAAPRFIKDQSRIAPGAPYPPMRPLADVAAAVLVPRLVKTESFTRASVPLPQPKAKRRVIKITKKRKAKRAQRYM